MNKTVSLLSPAALSLVSIPLTLSAQDAAEEQPRRPNIVYIMTDDHTAQMMSAYDKRNISTPNLDRIAADGVRFTNSFVANSTIYEYIQKIQPNGDVETIITECIYPNHTQIWYEERRYGLGTKLTKQESNPTLFQTLLSEREHFLQENKIRGCIDTILVGGKYFSTYDVIPNFDSTGVPKFLRYYNRSTGVFYNYNPKPIGLYNDFADSQRPDVIKRIK